MQRFLSVIIFGMAALGLAQSAIAATSEQATRARTCQIEDHVIAGSLTREPILARFESEIIHVSRGNGDIQIIDFFDYSCPACKALTPEFARLADTNPDVRIDLVEYPIYGRTTLSRITGNKTLHGTRVALAILASDPDAYLTFHDTLMATRGGVSDRKIRRAAEAAGTDFDNAVSLSKQDASKDSAEANMAYAKELGIEGTPGIVVDGIILSLGRWSMEDISCLLTEARKAEAVN